MRGAQLRKIDRSAEGAASDFAFSMHWEGKEAGADEFTAGPSPRLQLSNRRTVVSKSTKQEVIASDTALSKGITLKYPNATWTVANQQVTTQQVVSLLQKRIADNEASDLAHTAWLGACATATATMQQTNPAIHGVEQHIRADVGNDPAALGVFGLKPTKKGKKSAQVKAQAAEKSKATRKKNNTMGAAQRKATDKVAEHGAPAQEVTPEPVVQPAPATPSKQ
jgi:hypothetical protein